MQKVADSTSLCKQFLSSLWCVSAAVFTSDKCEMSYLPNQLERSTSPLHHFCANYVDDGKCYWPKNPVIVHVREWDKCLVRDVADGKAVMCVRQYWVHAVSVILCKTSSLDYWEPHDRLSHRKHITLRQWTALKQSLTLIIRPKRDSRHSESEQQYRCQYWGAH